MPATLYMVDFMFQRSQKLVLILYLIISLLSLTFYYPLNHYRTISSRRTVLETFHNKFLNISSNQYNQEQSQIGFHDFLRVIANQTHTGIWMNSIKESKLLQPENGTFKLQVFQKIQETQEYNLILKVFDGLYADDGQYSIFIEGSSIKTKQQFINNYLFYETTSPIIALQTHSNIFFQKKIKPLYINRLKFRVGFNENSQLKIQLLLAAEYDINIIVNDLYASPWMSPEILYCLMLTFQFLLKSFGTYWLFDQNQDNKGPTAPNLVKLSLCLDFTILISLAYLFFINEALKIYLIFPLSILIFNTFEMQYIFAEYIAPKDQSQNTKLGHNSQHIIFGLTGFIFFYALNLHWFYFIFVSCLTITPQIVYNYKIGGKPTYSKMSFCLYTLPNIMNIYYMRLYENNIFHLEPSYSLCIFCTIAIGLQIILVIVQQKIGSKAIVPEFINPQKLSPFKFFMIQTQDDTICSICSCDLSSLPSNLQYNSEQIIVNKVVVTPCKHQFHYYCMVEWEENKMQCPTCGQSLPPVNEEELYYH